MPREKVREAIDDMLRRGLSDLDPLIALLRRGPAAVAELALAAEQPQLKASLLAAVAGQRRRFATVAASLQRSVRRHPLTLELLATAGGVAIGQAALTAWDEGRRDEATFLADTAVALDSETGETLAVRARVALANSDGETVAALCGRILDEAADDALKLEAARELFAVGETKQALTWLMARDSADSAELVRCLSEAVQRGEAALADTLCGAVPDHDGWRTIRAAVASELRSAARRQLARLRLVVLRLQDQIDEAVADATAALAGGGDAVAGSANQAAQRASRLAADTAALAGISAITPESSAVVVATTPASLVTSAVGYAREHLSLRIDAGAPVAAESLTEGQMPPSAPDADREAAFFDYAYHAVRGALTAAGVRVIPRPPLIMVTLADSDAVHGDPPGLALPYLRGLAEQAPLIDAAATALTEVSATLTSAEITAGAAAPAGRVSLDRLKGALADCAQIAACLAIATMEEELRSEPLEPVLNVIVSGVRPHTDAAGGSLRATAPPSLSVRADHDILVGLLTLFVLDVADRSPSGANVSLKAGGPAAAGTISASVEADVPLMSPAPELVMALAMWVSAHGETMGDSAPTARGWGFELQAAASPVPAPAFEGATAEARMALRAAAGLLASDPETACFLVSKGAGAEAAAKLRAALARHLLLPRASSILASRVPKNGLTWAGVTVPQRRVEEICRAVVDDRLARRLSAEPRAYAACLVVFASPLGGSPPPVAIAGLPPADVESLTRALAGLADAAELRQPEAALAAATSALDALARVDLD